MRMILAAAAILALGGCGGGGEQAATTANGTVVGDATTNYTVDGEAASNGAEAMDMIAKITAMDDKNRNVVFVRAIMDAQNKCDGVIKSERQKDSEGLPVYRAYCRDESQHLLILQKDGTIHVQSAKPVT